MSKLLFLRQLSDSPRVSSILRTWLWMTWRGTCLTWSSSWPARTGTRITTRTSHWRGLWKWMRQPLSSQLTDRSCSHTFNTFDTSSLRNFRQLKIPISFEAFSDWWMTFSSSWSWSRTSFAEITSTPSTEPWRMWAKEPEDWREVNQGNVSVNVDCVST